MDARYLMGSCHHFAVALHRLTGWDLALIVGPMQGRDAIFHVFCIDDEGAAWDARGKQSVSDLVDEQTAMDGRETWPVRLENEAAVWSLSHGLDAHLNSIHPTHVLDALEAAESVIDGSAPIVSDGWKPLHPSAVEAASKGRMPLPAFDRSFAMDLAAAPSP